MNNKIRILIVEDNEDDFALLMRELKKSNYDIYHERVQEDPEFRNALKKEWDFIISDFSLPKFNGLEALKITKELGLEIPFIMVSGTVGEDIAVTMMRSGAKDYIMKDSLKRLLPAIDRELAEYRVRQRTRLAAMEKEVIFQINQDILSSENLEDLLNRIHNNIKKVIYAEYCYVALYNPDTDIISFPLFNDKYETKPEPRKKGKGISELILDTGKAMSISRKEMEEILKSNNIAFDRDIAESMMFAPLMSRSRQIGNIVIISYDKKYVYSDYEMNFLIGIADQIALAIERRQSEDKLKESEEFARALINATTDAAFLMDINRKALLLNDEFARRYGNGRTKEEMVGMNLHESLAPEISESRKLLEDEVIRTHKSARYLDSERGMILDNTVYPVFDKNGSVSGFAIFSRDVTEQRLAEEALRKSEEKYRTIFENVQNIFFVLDKDYFITEISPSVEKVSEYTREELIGKHVSVVYQNTDDLAKLAEMNRKFGSVNDYELKLKDKNGGIRIESNSSHLLFDEDGNMTGTEGILRDITERKRIEKNLKENEEKYKLLVQTMHDGIIQTDENDVVLFVNESTCRIFGYSEDELVGKVAKETLVFQGDRHIIEKKNQMRLNNLSDKYEIRGIKKSGEIIWLSVSGTPFRKDGKVIGSVGFMNDITEHKKATEELVKISHAVDQSPVIVMITDIKGRIEYVNPKFTEATGYSEKEVLGKNPRFLKSGETEKELYKNLWDTVLEGKQWTGELHNRKKNGELYWEYSTISPVRDSSGVMTHFLAVKEDITEKKIKEQELIAAKEKAEASERLKTNFLANMSHELRTPMIGILGFADLIRELADNPEMVEFSESIVKSGKRLMETLNLILDISRIEADKLEVNTNEVNVVPLAKEAYENYLAAAASKNLKISFRSSADDIVSKIDEKLFYESVNNLINNAIKYTKSGEIKVEVIADKSKSSKKTVVKITDTGIGIPEKHMDQIFEEFRQVSEGFSRGFEGTGLGLTITKKFVEKMGGKITVESEVGVGSVFSIELPLVDVSLPEKGQNGESAEEKPVPENTETEILCVEDDYFTTNFIGHILKGYFTVSFASNGLEAIDKAKSKLFDLVLMDINLGRGMNGVDTSKKIRKLEGYAEVPIVAMTAFAMKGDKEEFINSGMTNYISKPFKSSELINLITGELKKNK